MPSFLTSRSLYDWRFFGAPAIGVEATMFVSLHKFMGKRTCIYFLAGDEERFSLEGLY